MNATSKPTPVVVNPMTGLCRFVLSDEDVLRLAAASKPRILTLEDQRTSQEIANLLWATLGRTYGFDPGTVKRDPTTADPGTFLARAISTEPSND